jgi:membrane protein required for colicin V production
MIWVDFAIIGLVSSKLISGFLRGFNMAFFNLISWLLATIISLTFCIEFSVFLPSAISDQKLKISISFFALFLITLIMTRVIRVLFDETIKKSDIRLTERLSGMIFGGLHGLFIVMLLVMLTGLSSLPDEPWWKESKLLPPYQIAAIWLHDYIPSGIAEYIHYR